MPGSNSFGSGPGGTSPLCHPCHGDSPCVWGWAGTLKVLRGVTARGEKSAFIPGMVCAGRGLKAHSMPPVTVRDTFHCPRLLQALSNLALDTPTFGSQGAFARGGRWSCRGIWSWREGRREEGKGETSRKVSILQTSLGCPGRNAALLPCWVTSG